MNLLFSSILKTMANNYMSLVSRRRCWHFELLTFCTVSSQNHVLVTPVLQMLFQEVTCFLPPWLLLVLSTSLLEHGSQVVQARKRQSSMLSQRLWGQNSYIHPGEIKLKIYALNSWWPCWILASSSVSEESDGE